MKGVQTGIFLSAAFLVCVLANMFFFPDILWRHDARFSYIPDSEMNYETVFAMASQFFQGGIQLYDRFDAVNVAYTQMADGIFTVVNFLLSGIYFLCSPFLQYPAKAFHLLYSDGFYLLNMLIRTVGGYLFLRKFSSNPLVLLATLVYFNTIFMSPCFNNSLLTNSLYAYLPLLMYFLICFFERYNIVDLLWFFICLAVAVAHSPLLALGYFYQFVHVFILSLALLSVLRRHWPVWEKGKLWQKNRQAVFWTIGVCVLILLPTVLFLSSLKNDFYILNSGFGDTQGRIKNLFNVQGYMHLPNRSYASPADFVTLLFDYTQNLWGQSWYFLGAGAVLTGLVGAIVSKNPLKQVLVMATVFLLFLNIPPDPGSWTCWAHWINVLTNPFSFLVRSFHMSDLLWPTAMTGLLALGLQACVDLGQGHGERIHAKRLALTIGLLLGIGLFFILAHLAYSAYVVVSSGMICLYLALTRTKLYKNFAAARSTSLSVWAVIGLFIFSLMAWDFKVFVPFIHAYPLGEIKIKPRHFDTVSPVPLVLDYQNPKFFPFRYYFRQDPRTINPEIQTNGFEFGRFYQYYSLVPRFILPPDLYQPRPKIFKEISDDRPIWQYLFKDSRIMYWADAAVLADQVNFQDILDLGLDRRVLMVEGDHVPNLSDARQLKLGPPIEIQDNIYEHRFDFNQARPKARGPHVEYRFDLPDTFPQFISTTVFSQDADLWSVKAGSVRLFPVQGELSDAFTFDVNNVKDHELRLLLPREVPIQGLGLDLRLKTPGDIKRIWQNTNDALGLDYAAPKDGWVIVHFPFDPKWSLTVDGQPAPYFKANRYFMAFPITQGEHKILWRYWPGTPLRILIVISVLCAAAALAAAFREGLRRLQVPST